jgi:hypothetical protein
MITSLPAALPIVGASAPSHPAYAATASDSLSPLYTCAIADKSPYSAAASDVSLTTYTCTIADKTIYQAITTDTASSGVCAVSDSPE